ncbi:MAG: M23 family metallopeptidase [Parcubacteria group bacterium]|nr:M23 family metallopeptidase [Parcubacteria group bacterium]
MQGDNIYIEEIINAKSCNKDRYAEFTHDVTDLSKVYAIIPPGNIEEYGEERIFKSHSYIKPSGKVPIYAPVDSTLYEGSYYIEEGHNQYSLFLEINCDVYYILDHIIDVPDKIKEVFPKEPKIDSKTQLVSEKVEIEAGELVGYSVGSDFEQFDLGIYDKSFKNELVNADFQDILYDRDYYARCPYDYFAEEEQNDYKSLYNSHIDQEVPTIICKDAKSGVELSDAEVKSEDIENDENEFVEPIAEFVKRITKKPFGIYIEPSSSPVQPEKFQGYHTGSDVEYEDVDYEVEVFAIENGKVILSKWVSGYGGVVAISHNIENENVIFLYGHLDPESLVSINNEVIKGSKIGILGDGETSETDFERKHLHFGIIKGNSIDLKGYVNNESGLGGWYNPVEFLKR